MYCATCILLFVLIGNKVVASLLAEWSSSQVAWSSEIEMGTISVRSDKTTTLVYCMCLECKILVNVTGLVSF